MTTESWMYHPVQILQWDMELSRERIIQTLVVSATMALALVCMKRSLREKKKYPPGVPALPIVGSIPFMKFSAKSNHLDAMDYFKKYGNVYSVWLGNTLVVRLGGYDVIREALVDQAVAFAGRAHGLSKIYPLCLNPKTRGICVGSYSPRWKENRNVCLSILRDFGFGKNLMESRILDEMHSLIARIRDLNGAACNPRPSLTTSVANVISSIVLGKRYPHDDCTELQSFIEDIDLFLLNGGKTMPLWFLPSLRHLPHFKRAVRANVEYHDRILMFLREFIRQHQEAYQDGKEDDFIHAFFSQVGQDSDELVFNLRDLFFGGTEITITLQWALLYMANYPQIQAKVQEEIQRELGQGHTVTLQDKNRLPYTEAVLLEIQRVCVVVPFSVPHTTLSDVKLRGYDIPKDSVVLISLWSVLRDPELWPEPEKLIPERFLNDEGKVVHKPELINFSLGRRRCPGEVMASQELFLFFCGLMQNFTIRAPEGVGKLDEGGMAGTTRTPLPFEVIAESRT